MYIVFACMPDESYRRRLRSFLLYLRYVFRTVINSLVCRFIVKRQGPMVGASRVYQNIISIAIIIIFMIIIISCPLLRGSGVAHWGRCQKRDGEVAGTRFWAKSVSTYSFVSQDSMSGPWKNGKLRGPASSVLCMLKIAR